MTPDLFVYLYRKIRTAHSAEGTACAIVFGYENGRVKALFVEIIPDCYKSFRTCRDAEATSLAPFT